MSCGTYNPRENAKIITFMSYNQWEDIKDGMNERRLRRIAKERRRKAMYFKRQHIAGAAIFIVGIICLMIGCRFDKMLLQYFGAPVGLAGLYLVLTKRMVLVDNYFLERQDKMNEY